MISGEDLKQSSATLQSVHPISVRAVLLAASSTARSLTFAQVNASGWHSQGIASTAESELADLLQEGSVATNR